MTGVFIFEKPVREWFNRTAPMVKSGDVGPETLSAQSALDLMITDPILIKRPLIHVGNKYVKGFDTDHIHRWIGLSATAGNELEVDAFQQDDLTICPMLAKTTICDDIKK